MVYLNGRVGDPLIRGLQSAASRLGPSPHTEAGRLGATSGEAPAAGGHIEARVLGHVGRDPQRAGGPMSGRGARFLWIVTFRAFLLLFVCVEKLRLLIGLGLGEVVGIYRKFMAPLIIFWRVGNLRLLIGLVGVGGDVLVY